MSHPFESPLKTDRRSMDPSRAASAEMLLAVQNRNMAAFRQALAQGFDVRSYVRPKKSSKAMPFVEKVARSRFSEALRVLLVETSPCVISREDAVRAFHASVKSGPPQAIITVFVEASCLGTLPVLSLADSYRYAMEFNCSSLARRVVDVQGFDANCCVRLFAGAWERPIHSAVKRNQYETATRLLHLGAEVDAPNCHGITALVMACRKVSVDSVRLLLAHGADPNSAERIRVNAWPLAASKISFTMFKKLKIPFYLNLQTSSLDLVSSADKIVAMLLSSGLRPSIGNWFLRTSVVIHMSSESVTALCDIYRRVPTLSEAAIIQGRQVIRMMMKEKRGVGFNETLKDLPLPHGMKDQLKIDLIN